MHIQPRLTIKKTLKNPKICIAETWKLNHWPYADLFKIIYPSDWGNWECLCNHLPRLEYEQYSFQDEIKDNNAAYVGE